MMLKYFETWFFGLNESWCFYSVGEAISVDYVIF